MHILQYHASFVYRFSHARFSSFVNPLYIARPFTQFHWQTDADVYARQGEVYTSLPSALYLGHYVVQRSITAVDPRMLLRRQRAHTSTHTLKQSAVCNDSQWFRHGMLK